MLEKLLELSKNKEANYLNNRILSELKYAYIISQTKGGRYDEILHKTEQLILDGYKKNGTITNELVFQAEKLMEDLKYEAKNFEVICAAHAHIDMNWMWGWDETVSVTLDTFRTMLDIMKEYQAFKFSQSQASVYKIVQEHDPEMLEEIKKRVKEGRWEITASTWVEADKNMPNGESLSRHILYTKKYLSELFDIKPESLNIDFEPDTFGHSLNIPEILSQGGVKYYYHCRGNEGHSLYRWISPSGAELIVNWEPNWYNSTIDSDIAFCIPDLAGKCGINTVLKVYGVGDHGGGPTRRDIERIIDMNNWPIFPKIKFGTFGEYFSKVEAAKDRLPIVRGEQNFLCDGCYTSQSKIKEGNRKSEALLNEAELFSSFTSIYTNALYPTKEFEEAWRSVLFNQFHDIITGSGVAETRAYALGLYQKVLATANSKRKIAFKKIADKINTLGLVPLNEDISECTADGAGVGTVQCGRGAGKTRVFHIFNPSVTNRKEVAEVMVWDWNGDINRIVFKNENGQKVQHQVVEKGFNEYWSHYYLKVLIKVDVPSCGYTTYAMTEDKITDIKVSYYCEMRVQKVDEFFLENSLLKVIFNSMDGSISSLIDKTTGKELIDVERKSGIFKLIDEGDNKEITAGNPGMSAWFIGRYKNIDSLNKNVEMKKIQGPLRSTIIYETEFRNSKLSVKVSLDEDSSLLNFEVKCDWHEIGKLGKGIPQLGFYMPLPYQCTSYKYDIPFGVINREGMDMDLPGNSFVTGISKDNKKSLMLISNSKYGFRCVKDDMAITLLRSSYDPDPYPEFGIHNFRFSLGIVDSLKTNNQLINFAYDYNHPLSILSGTGHKGELPLQNQFISVEEGSIVVSAVKMPEIDGVNKLLVRIYETDGIKTRTVLKFFRRPERAYFVDVNENKLELSDTNIEIIDEKISFDLLAFKSASIIVEFKYYEEILKLTLK